MSEEKSKIGLTLGLDMPLEAVEILRSHGTTRTYQTNQMAVSVGDDFDNLFIVEEGRFSISIIDRHGRSSIYGYLGAGSTWGLKAALTGKPASFFFEAVEESTVTCVSRKTLWTLIDNNKIARHGIIFSLGWAVSMSTSFGHQERTLPLKSRLANFLIANADKHGTVELPQAVLARNLGVSRYAVGSHLQDFKRRSLIEIEYGRVRIIAPDELQRLGTRR